jgi:hypothetical protein
MMIRFKCEHCQKPLSVKETLAGKRANCPSCRKPIQIPAPVSAPADLEDFAASALADPVAPKDDATTKPIDFTCSMCGEDVQVPFDMAGKQTPCPLCKRIVKVPLPKVDKPKDWRDLDKKGPAAALINQPEQLDGAWGTEVKGRVSRAALEEAEAVPVVVQVEPIGIGGWIRRVFWTAAVVGFVALIYYGAELNIRRKLQKGAVADAFELVKRNEAEKDPKLRFSPVLIAEIHRADGEMKLREGKLAETIRTAFQNARALIQTSKDTSVDHDLFLIDLALSQLGLGGSEDEVRSKKRYDLEGLEVTREVSQTLGLIKAPEAKMIGLREVAASLKARDRIALAITFAGALRNPAQAEIDKDPAKVQQTVLIVAFGDLKKVSPLIAPFDPKKQLAEQDQSIIAYAEAAAWKGPSQLDKAKELLQLNTPALVKVEAALGVASILFLTRPKEEAASLATPYLAEAFTNIEKPRDPSPWLRLQLFRLACRTEHAEQAKKLFLDPKSRLELPGPFKRRAQLELLRVQLEKAGASATMEMKELLPDKEGPNRALGWIVLARHLTFHGAKVELPDDGDDAPLRPFANLGIVLGNQDRGRQ